MTFKVRWLKMAEGKSSVVTVCHCHDNEDPFRDDHSGGYSKTWDLLKTLHVEKDFITEEECRKNGEAGYFWFYELACTIAVKPPDVVELVMDVLEEYKNGEWYSLTANRIKVLSELYQEKLVTEDEVKRMKGEGGDLFYELISIQYTRPLEVVTRTAETLVKFGHNEEARQLRVLNELFIKQLLTAEECSEVAGKGPLELYQVLLMKPAEVVQEAVQMLEKHGCDVKKELKMLSELYQEKLVTEDEVKKINQGRDLLHQLVLTQWANPPEVVTRISDLMATFGYKEETVQLRVLNELFTRDFLTTQECSVLARKERWQWELHLCETLLTKPAEVVQVAVQMLEEHGCYVKKELKMLSELYQEKLVTEDEVKRIKEGPDLRFQRLPIQKEGGYLPRRLIRIQYTKPSEVVIRTATIFSKFGHNEESIQLRVLNELFTRHLLTAEECSDLAPKGHLTAYVFHHVPEKVQWENHLCEVLLMKPAKVVQEAVQMLEKHNCCVTELKMLAELYQEKLVAEDEVTRMEGRGGDLLYQLIPIQFSKPPEVVTKTADILDTIGFNNEAIQLRVLNELFTSHLLTREECSEVARKRRWSSEWADYLHQVLLRKPAYVVQEAFQVMEKHGCRVKEELKILNELFASHLLTREECSEVARKRRWSSEWADYLHQVLLTKPAYVVQEAIQVMEKHGCRVKKELKMLSELYQEKLVTEDEVKRMNREGGDLLFQLISLQFANPPEVVSSTAELLVKFGWNVEARQLRVLSELYQEKLVTEDEVKRMKGEGWDLLYQLIPIQYTKPPEVVNRISDLMTKFGRNDEARQLRVLSELYQEKLMTEDEVKRMKGEGEFRLYQLIPIQYTKPLEVVTRTAAIMAMFEHNKEAIQLRVLNGLFTRHLLTEECSEMARRRRWEWEDHLFRVLLTKPTEVVQEAIQVLEKHGCCVKKELKILSELYQEKLVTEGEVKRMKGEFQLYQLIPIQYTKPPEVVTRTAAIMATFEHNKEAIQLRVLNEVFTRHLLTAEEYSAEAMKMYWSCELEHYLHQVLLTKPAYVVQEAIQVMEKHGCHVKKELKILNELFTRHLLTTEECSDMAKKGHLTAYKFSEVAGKGQWENHLCQVLLAKPAEVVQEAIQVLEEHRCHVKEELKMLSELYQEKLVTEDEVKMMKEEEDLLYQLISIQFSKPPEVVTKTADILDIFVFNKEAIQLRVLNELFTRHLITTEECSEVAGKRRWEWEDHLCQVLLTKPADIMQDVIQMLEEHVCHVNEELKKSFLSLSSEEEKATGQRSKVPSHPAGGGSNYPKEPDTYTVKAAETALDDLCWLPFGVQSQSVRPEGGKLCLHPSVGEEEGQTILLEVPPGAVSPSQSVDVCSAIIPDGPFALPEGYQLGSMAVYINYDGRRVTKPLKLHLPHWYGGEDHVRDGLSFAMAPHTLKEGEHLYQFELLEGGRRLSSSCWELEINGHSSLFAEVFKKGAISHYQAIALQKPEGDETTCDVAVTYAFPLWCEILSKYRNGWTAGKPSCSFTFAEDGLKGKLREESGNGWQAAISGSSKLEPAEVEYTSSGITSPKLLKVAVLNRGYPPSITFAVTYREELRRTGKPVWVHLDMFGAGKELTFMCKAYEEHDQQRLGVSRNAAAASQSPLAPPPDPPPHDVVNDLHSTASPQAETAAPISVSEVFETHETDFFSVVNPQFSLLRLQRKGVITQDVASRISAATNEQDAQEILFAHLSHSANVNTLREYCEVIIAADGLPMMQSFGRRMKEELQQGVPHTGKQTS